MNSDPKTVESAIEAELVRFGIILDNEVLAERIRIRLMLEGVLK